MASAEEIAKSLAGAIGANDDETTVKHFLDSGFPPLNNASSSGWGGCFPVGRLIEIAGPSSAGKTALATRAMAAAQKLGGIAGFNDHERSFSLRLAPKLGLDATPGRFVFKKPKTFEGSLEICARAAEHIRSKKLIDEDAPICWVFDSLASMVPQSALFDSKGNVKSMEDRNMNDNTALSRATAAHFPAFAQFCEEYGVCAIFLNQMRTKIGVMFGDNRKTTGGNAAEHYFSQRLWLSAAKIKGTNGDITGQEVTGVFVKNKIARPFRSAKWRFMFQDDGTGRFDRERSLVDFLVAEGILPRSGNKIEFEGGKYGAEQLARKIEKEDAFDKLVDLLPEAYEAPVVAEFEAEVEAEESEAA